jgi:hypothetical protein
MPAMHPYIADVFSTLDASRARFRAAVDAVPDGLRQQRPAPDRWSVCEILHHMSLVERRFGGALRERIAQAREAGLGPEHGERTPLADRVAAIMGDRSNRRSAPEPFHPQSLPCDEAWTAAEQAREEFRQIFIEADGLALSGVVYTHHAFGDLTAYQLAELVSGHEARHTEQIQEIATAMAGQQRA